MCSKNRGETLKNNAMESHGGDLPTSAVSDQVRTRFVELVQDASRAMKRGDFPLAARLYTDAIILDPANHVLYSNRAVIHQKMNQWNEALYDARKCKQLKPDWSKGHLREGVSLKQLGRLADAITSFCAGLGCDPQSDSLMQSLHETLSSSPLYAQFSPVFDQLIRLRQERNPFLITSVIGQELLKLSKYSASVSALEAALRIGTSSLPLKGSVLSALSSAHWALGNVEQAIVYMRQDLEASKSLGDLRGECRAYANLGAAYFSKGSYKAALHYRRLQLTSVIRLKDHSLIVSVLSHLGHVCAAVGDYRGALLCHKRCAWLAKQKRDRLVEACEIGNAGAVYLASGDVVKALECHHEHLKISQTIGNRFEEARAFSSLGSAYHFQRRFERAVEYHKEVLKIATELGDQTLEARANSGLGHAARCQRDYVKAKYYHERQLDNALHTKDKMAEGRACSNLGIVYQLLGEYEAALRLHKAHLRIAKDLGDRASQGRAYGNIGNAYSSLKRYELAVRFHKQELAISKEVCDKHAESSTHGNLAYAYQALGMKELALQSYSTHLAMAQTLNDRASEARALCNIGNYLCSMKLHDQAVTYYEKFLQISEELDDSDGSGTACHGLGYAYYCLANFSKSVLYYEKNLTLAKDLLDKSQLCRAYCNLGLAQKALGNYEESLACQRRFLDAASELKNASGKFYALGNIGDVLLKLREGSEATNVFDRQLRLSRQIQERKMEAIALGNLGNCSHLLNHLDKALSYHMQELTIYQDLTDAKGESRAHGCVGNIHMMLGNYMSAYRSYEEQLDRSREIGDVEGEAFAYGNMGITKTNSNKYEDAIGFFEQQLALLQQVVGSRARSEQGRAYRNMGDCYSAIGEHREAIRCYEKYLFIIPDSVSEQSCAYHSLGCAFRAVGSLQQALVCFEKRLVAAHKLSDREIIGCAYGELGCLHSLMGNFDQAINCLQNQRRIAQDRKDRSAESEAACALGGVYHQMAEFDKALEFHHIDLELSTGTKNASTQCRAHGNLGLSYESLGRFDEAVRHQLKQLTLATKLEDNVTKTLALTSLGRVYHAMGRYPEAVDSLQQGLEIAVKNGQKEDKAKLRHRLGLAFWLQGNFEDAQRQLYLAIEHFESIRREVQYNNDYKMSLFELQTAAFQALQRVLIALDRPDEALLVAERGRTRAFVDMLLERQGNESMSGCVVDSSPVTMEALLATINHQDRAVLYFSLAAGYLYSWLILPNKGVVKFHECSLTEPDLASIAGSEVQSVSSSFSTASLLDACIAKSREAIGVEPQTSASRVELDNDEPSTDSNLTQLGDRLNAESDSLGFLRMTSRSEAWNCSSFSIGSLVSVRGNGSFGQRNTSLRSSSGQTTKDEEAKSPLVRLYELLIGPMEDVLSTAADSSGFKSLVLVLQGDLYLVPFSLLRPSQSAAFLYERYNLLVAPSIHAIQSAQKISDHGKHKTDSAGAIVIGNPKISPDVCAAFQWRPLPAAEQECRFVAEVLGCRTLTGAKATRDAVVQEMRHVEVVHFATNVSWQLSSIVLACNSFDQSKTWAKYGSHEDSFDGPALSEHLLTAADILGIPIRAKLVIVNSSHADDRASRINADGVIGLTRAFLAAGAQCVMFPLWPVPESASSLLLKTFYKGLLQGYSVSRALNDAMKVVHGTRQFSHPSNWACWTLVGADVRISSKAALMGRGFEALLETPAQSREAMRVVLHLVEKTLQRLRNGQKNSMFMTRASIEKRVGGVSGWQDVLTAMGFQFEPETSNGPATVFFPVSDLGDRLAWCSTVLQALLGLSVQSLICLSKIKNLPEVGRTLISVLQNLLDRHRGQTAQGAKNANPLTKLQMDVWSLSGIHEFLASLGFELVDVGKDEVTIGLGRQASHRQIRYSILALMGIFDGPDAPRVLLESSSSMESLTSTSESINSPLSNYGSNRPVSPPYANKKSYFNPAEVDKFPSAMKNQTLTSKTCVSGSTGPDMNLQLTHQTIIRSKYSSPSSTSDASDASHRDPMSRSQVIPSQNDSPDEKNTYDRGRHSSSRSYSRGQGYSTSTSEGEDVWGCLESHRSKASSRAGGATPRDTSSGKSVGNSGGRRLRSRASVFGSKTSIAEQCADGRVGHSNAIASKESLSGELYDLDGALENLTDSGIQTTPKHTDSNTDNSTDLENSAARRKHETQIANISALKTDANKAPLTSQASQPSDANRFVSLSGKVVVNVNPRSVEPQREDVASRQLQSHLRKTSSTDCGDLDKRKSDDRTMQLKSSVSGMNRSVSGQSVHQMNDSRVLISKQSDGGSSARFDDGRLMRDRAETKSLRSDLLHGSDSTTVKSSVERGVGGACQGLRIEDVPNSRAVGNNAFPRGPGCGSGSELPVQSSRPGIHPHPLQSISINSHSVFPGSFFNRPFPSQEDLAAPYIINAPPTILKDALANIPPPLPGRSRGSNQTHTTWDPQACDFNSPQSLQRASALFFRTSSDRSAFSRPPPKQVFRQTDSYGGSHGESKTRINTAVSNSSCLASPGQFDASESGKVLDSVHRIVQVDRSRLEPARRTAEARDSSVKHSLHAVPEYERVQGNAGWQCKSAAGPLTEKNARRSDGIKNVALHASRF